MSPDQFNQLLAALSKLADRPYTLTGAADWPILAFMLVIFIGVIGWMWRDLKATIKDGRQENKADLSEYKQTHSEEHKNLWQALKDCQGDCCPRGGRE